MARKKRFRGSKRRKKTRPKRKAKTASRRARQKRVKKTGRVRKRASARKPAVARPRASAGVSRVADPHIDWIDPNLINRNSAVTLTLKGADFTPDCIVLIDDANPHYRYIDPGKMQASLNEDDTDKPGRKEVKVHGGQTGTISNTVYLTIE